MKETKTDGFCAILGKPCYEECPHHYYREHNGCWLPPLLRTTENTREQSSPNHSDE